MGWSMQALDLPDDTTYYTPSTLYAIIPLKTVLRITYTPNRNGILKFDSNNTSAASTYGIYGFLLSGEAPSPNSSSTSNTSSITFGYNTTLLSADTTSATPVVFEHSCEAGTTYHICINGSYNSTVQVYCPFTFEYILPYTITYDLQGGSWNDTLTQSYNANDDNIVIKSTIPTKAGYTFLGWKHPTITNTLFMPGISYFQPWSPGDVTLEAIWEASMGTITYDSNGGSGGPGEISFNLNTEVIIDTNTYPFKDGYVFKGWSTDSSAKRPQYWVNKEYNTILDNNLILYAVWWPQLIWEDHSIKEINRINSCINDFCNPTNNDTISSGMIYKWSWIYNLASALLVENQITNQKIIKNSIIELLINAYNTYTT